MGIMIGEAGVAAYGVIMYVALVFAGAFIGYSVGCAPLMSWNHFHLRGTIMGWRLMGSKLKWLRTHREFGWPDLRPFVTSTGYCPDALRLGRLEG